MKMHLLHGVLLLLTIPSLVYAYPSADDAVDERSRQEIIEKTLDYYSGVQEETAFKLNHQEGSNEYELILPPVSKPNDNQQPKEKQASDPSEIKSRTHSLSFEHEVFFDKLSYYKRKNVTGLWQGYAGKYVFRPPKGNILNTPVFNYYSLEGLYAFGKNTKRGVVQTDFLTIKNIPASMYEYRLLLGRDIMASKNIRVTPYIGYGIRSRTDDSHGHVDPLSDPLDLPIWGFHQSTFYQYIPVGLTTDMMINKSYEIAFNFEYDFLFKGVTKYHLSDLDPYATSYLSQFGYDSANFEDIRVTQRGGFGLRSSLKLLKHLSLFDVYIESFIRYWNIKESKTGDGYIITTSPEDISQSTLRELKNYTLEGGLKTGIQF